MNFLDFRTGSEYKFSEIADFLVENGYEQSYMVEKKGEFSRRGDILDIFPPNMENPIRFEFFDEELESIREFDVDSQRSLSRLEEIKIFGNILSGNNYELVEVLGEVDTNPLLLPKVLKLLLGKEQVEKLKNHLRDTDGIIAPEKITAELEDIFKAQQKLKK